MKKFTLILAVTLITGCANNQATPVTSSAATSQVDQSWSAAVGAFLAQGVRVTNQDRDAGMLQGISKGVGVSAYILTSAEGSIRVKFENTSGTTNSDPGLIRRITRSYNSRMGY